ncbi:hypothetical protein QBC40DRAFT_219024 [Triangularia verruculosa]|uniref:Uncharacterized protein n=1 Tax=Triangularia verruculosa TaxID=2587418 RepID=A0AAN6XS12_9PEZI|nr:hypothetical protein QBC40DRAFT_219024 [Triangularia verruculosa]
MAFQPSFNSNNPFRRKPVVAPASSSADVVPGQTPTFAQSSPPPPPPPPTLRNIQGDEPCDESAGDAASTLPTGDQFWTTLQSAPRPAQPPPTTSFQKPKVIKRVRVQSPPPSSPESEGFGERFPPIGGGEDEEESDSDGDGSEEEGGEVDPFGAGGSNRSSAEELGVLGGEEREGRGPPRISFQMGVREEVEEDKEMGAGTKGGLDVDAFKRLLLTGQVGVAGPARLTVSSVDLGRIEENTDSDVPRQTQATPRLLQQTPEQPLGDEQHSSTATSQTTLQPAPTILRKKPPPPSSRHGKLIRPDPARQESSGSVGKTSSSSSLASPRPPTPTTSSSRQRPPTPSDVNKPLPSQPSVSEDSNIFDHEAAGKIPEPAIPDPGLHIIHALRSPTPPNTSHSTLPTPPPSRKPAPPPRRQPHGRSDSKPSTPFPSEDVIDPGTRRSSIDSTRSRSSSFRAIVHAPAPPPPRRPSQRLVASPSSEAISPLASQISATPPPLSGSSTPNNNLTPTPGAVVAVEGIASPPVGTPGGGGLKEKLSPPPPPPTRGASVRGKRPVSSGGGEVVGVVRRGSGNNSRPAPPPVPKHRGSVVKVVVEGEGGGGGEQQQGVDILADLTRLQREVDELRAGLANGGK